MKFRVRDNFFFIESWVFAHMICVPIRHLPVTADGDTYSVVEHFTFVENWISAPPLDMCPLRLFWRHNRRGYISWGHLSSAGTFYFVESSWYLTPGYVPPYVIFTSEQSGFVESLISDPCICIPFTLWLELVYGLIYLTICRRHSEYNIKILCRWLLRNPQPRLFVKCSLNEREGWLMLWLNLQSKQLPRFRLCMMSQLNCSLTFFLVFMCFVIVYV